jgi:hypothetical protein
VKCLVITHIFFTHAYRQGKLLTLMNGGGKNAPCRQQTAVGNPPEPCSGKRSFGNASHRRLWAYRKAAWAVEDLEQDIGLVHRTMALKGLQSIPNIGLSLGREVERLISVLDGR